MLWEIKTEPTTAPLTERLCTVVVASVLLPQVDSLLQLLASRFPLPPWLAHLRRVRKAPACAAVCSNICLACSLADGCGRRIALGLCRGVRCVLAAATSPEQTHTSCNQNINKRTSFSHSFPPSVRAAQQRLVQGNRLKVDKLSRNFPMHK